MSTKDTEVTDNLANQALHRPTAGGDVVSGVLANRVETDTGTGTGLGQSVTYSAPSITRTAGAPGKFQVSATLNVEASSDGPAVGDPLTFQLVRDPGGGETLVGPAVDLPSLAGGLQAVTLSWNDAGGAGAHVYAIRCTNGTGGHNVAVNGSGSSSIEVQETL
jgi:hypothetical protein